MIPQYYVDNNFSKARDIDNNLDRFIINYCHKLIDNDKD